MNGISKYILVVWFLSVFYVQSMDRPKKFLRQGVSWMHNQLDWVRNTGQILLGGLPLSSPLLFQSAPFNTLPSDIQKTIIDLLQKQYDAQSVTEAIATIKSLSMVNKDLNNLVKNPVFILHLVKSLGERFNADSSSIYKALGAPAKDIWTNQLLFLNLVMQCPQQKKSLQKCFSKIKEFIDTKLIDINFTDEILQCPLYQAIISGNLQLVTLLIEHGANPCLLMPNKKTPFIVSIEQASGDKKYREIFEYLLTQLPPGYVETKTEGKSFLFYAIMQYDIETIKTLLDFIVPTDSDLKMAQFKGNQEIIKLLKDRIKKNK